MTKTLGKKTSISKINDFLEKVFTSFPHSLKMFQNFSYFGTGCRCCWQSRKVKAKREPTKMQIESTIRSWWCEAFLSVSTSHCRSMLELPLQPISLCWSDDEGWSDTDSDVLTLDKMEEVGRSTQGGPRFLGVVGHRQAPPLPSLPSPTCHHLSLPKPELKLVKIQPRSSPVKRLVLDCHRFPPASEFLHPMPEQIIYPQHHCQWFFNQITFVGRWSVWTEMTGRTSLSWFCSPQTGTQPLLAKECNVN